MAFCASCGAPVEGRFCAKCGASMAAGAAPGGPSPEPGGPPPNPQPVYNPPPISAGGMDDNMAAALCYVLGFVTGIIFLVLDPYNKKPFVRFHAFQSIFLNVAWIAAYMVLGVVEAILHLWLLFSALWGLLGLVAFALWLFCMYKAYNREWFQLPIIGPIALKQSGAGQPS